MENNVIMLEVEKIESAAGGKKIITINQAADYIGIDAADIEGLIKSGELQSKNIGSKHYIMPIDLARFLLGEGKNEMKNYVEKPLDFRFQVQYHPLTIEDLSEEEYLGMERRGRGEGSLYFNEGRQVWQVAISLGKDENGKRLRKIISAKEKQEVLDAWTSFLSNSAKVVEQPASSVIPLVNPRATEITVKELLDEHLKTIQNGVKERTFASYLGSAKLVEKDIGDMLGIDLDENVLQRYLNEFSTKKYEKGKTKDYYSQSAIHKVCLVLNMIIEEAFKKKIISHRFELNEPESNKHTPDEDEYLALEDHEIKMILEAVSENLMIKTAIIIMNYTGMRPGEAFAIRFKDIDFEKRTISVKQAIGLEQKVDIETKTFIKNSRKAFLKNIKNDRKTKGKDKTNYARRTLKVSQKVIDAIIEWKKYIETKPEYLAKKKEQGNEDLVFTGIRGQLVLLEYYHQVYERLMIKSKLDSKVYNLYRFRHNYCTRLLKAKYDIKTVMKLMGDNDMEVIVKIYNSINKDDVIKASDEYSTEMDTILEDVI